VLVVSSRQQVEDKLTLEGHATCKYFNNHRITDAQTLKTVKECSGLARSEVEARMSRSLRTSGTAGTAVNVVSGNFFFTAQPIGVIDGVDYQYTGDVRKIDAKNMRARLDAGDVVLLTSVGYGASGESYYVLTADLAAKCAGALVSRRFAHLPLLFRVAVDVPPSVRRPHHLHRCLRRRLYYRHHRYYRHHCRARRSSYGSQRVRRSCLATLARSCSPCGE
jgi:hypothetical protein